VEGAQTPEIDLLAVELLQDLAYFADEPFSGERLFDEVGAGIKNAMMDYRVIRVARHEEHSDR